MRLATALIPFLLLLAAAHVPAHDAYAETALKARTYHFGTHPARTNITFVSEADLETIHGITHAVSGSVTVDATGESAGGSLRVGVATLKTGIDLRDEHLRSDQWLDAARHPWILLEAIKATEGKAKGHWSYTARLTIKGTTHDLKGSANVTTIPEEIGKVLGEGSWLRLRTKFDVKLADFGIKVPTAVGAKVSNTWMVSVDLYGTTVREKTR